MYISVSKMMCMYMDMAMPMPMLFRVHLQPPIANRKAISPIDLTPRAGSIGT